MQSADHSGADTPFIRLAVVIVYYPRIPSNMADAEVRVEIVKPLKVFVFVADLNICNFLIEENSRDGNRGSYQCGLGAPP